MSILPFAPSKPFSLGVKLEMQLLERDGHTLATNAQDFAAYITSCDCGQQVKPEVASGMVEMKSGVHTCAHHLIQELNHLRNALVKGAQQSRLDVSGGGAHPFQCLRDGQLSREKEFRNVHERYGYLAKASTVFGQHIHIGVPNGDDALYLTHGFSRFVPHFIALSAASPFYRGMDTAFDSSRSNVVGTFPLVGTVPLVTRWRDFESCYYELKQIGLVRSLQDFYWDIRPKPEYGTVEIRVCDTPLTVGHAALLACYAQLLARWLLTERPFDIHDDFYACYRANRFEASRYGLNGEIAGFQDGSSSSSTQSIYASVLDSVSGLKRYATSDTDFAALKRLRHMASTKLNDACQLRNAFKQRGSLNDVMRLSSQLWMTHTASPYVQ